MTLNALPAVIATVLAATLALATWLAPRPDRASRAFALFASLLALLSFGYVMLFNAAHESEVKLWLRCPGLMVPLAFGAALRYALVLTGYWRTRRSRVLGIPVRAAVVAIAATLLAFAIAWQFSRTFETVVIRDGQVIHIELTWLAYGYWLCFGLAQLFFFGLLIGAARREKVRRQRRLLWINVVSFALIYISPPLTALLTRLVTGTVTMHWALIGTAFSTVLFYISIVHYQFDAIEELAMTLEAKVDERTRHLREAQAQLVQAQRIASLDRLVAGVSHEFNTPLGAVQSSQRTATRWIERLGEQIAPLLARADDESRRRIERTLARLGDSNEVVGDGTARVASIVRRMKAFARLDESAVQVVDLHDNIDAALAMLPSGWQTRIELVRELGELPRLLCFPAQVNQVLLYILVNAVEALGKDGGTITVRTRVDLSHDPKQVVIEIADDGPGIPAELLEQVFDPGMTTKRGGIGTGLGLAICYQVMRQHHGRVVINSEPGAGTTVALHFPVDLERWLDPNSSAVTLTARAAADQADTPRDNQHED